MPKVIILTNVDLESYFNYTMEYLDAKYHQFPHSFRELKISDEHAGTISSLNNMAEHVQADCSSGAPPVGKQVY